MQDTCVGKDCKFIRKLKLKPEECPNYCENWFTPAPTSGDSQPKLLRDCLSKRLTLMVQELSNRLVGVEKSQEQTRNKIILTTEAMADSFKKLMGFAEKRKDLEKKTIEISA